MVIVIMAVIVVVVLVVVLVEVVVVVMVVVVVAVSVSVAVAVPLAVDVVVAVTVAMAMAVCGGDPARDKIRGGCGGCWNPGTWVPQIGPITQILPIYGRVNLDEEEQNRSKTRPA